MDISGAISVLSKHVANPSVGLPDEVFRYISQTTPLVNVDLLIKDENDRTLLSWRDDALCGKGWHVPGGIIRFKEKFETRIRKVVETEIGTDVKFDPKPIAINQVINLEYTVRAHFISLLFRCSLSEKFIPENKGLTETDKGYLKWHKGCPHNIINVHEMYRKYM